MKRAGLVFVNYNRGHLVSEIIGAFSNYSSLSAIVVVDNCSTDDSRLLLSELERNGTSHRKGGMTLTCLFPEENLGYAKGNNLGLQYLREICKCEYCFVVNPDVYFIEDVINSIIDAFENNPDYAIITSARIDPLAEKPQLQYMTRVYDTFNLQFLSYFNLARHYYLLKKYGVYTYDTRKSDLIDIAVAPGSFFGIRMNAFPDGKVLDERTFLYGEEDLLSMKCKKMGLKIGFLSNVIYEHRHIQHSTTLGKKSVKPIKYALTSKRYFQKKYVHLNTLQRGLLLLAEKISLFERYIILCLK